MALAKEQAELEAKEATIRRAAEMEADWEAYKGEKREHLASLSVTLYPDSISDGGDGGSTYYGAVSLARSSAVQINVGSDPFVFDVTTLPREKVDLQYSLWLGQLRRLGNVLALRNFCNMARRKYFRRDAITLSLRFCRRCPRGWVHCCVLFRIAHSPQLHLEEQCFTLHCRRGARAPARRGEVG